MVKNKRKIDLEERWSNYFLLIILITFIILLILIFIKEGFPLP